MERKKLPIGLSDFKELIERNYYYVDKSLLIKELIDSGSKITLLPRPRRFGKTLNLEMLRYFFANSEEDNSTLFADLAIWKAGEKYRNLQGQYPVIYLTLKEVKFNDWPNCLREIKVCLAKTFEEHRYLRESSHLENFEKEKLALFIRGEAEDFDCYNSLRFLIKLLHRHFNKKVVVLIDEYDVPIQQGYLKNFYSKAVEFMQIFLGALKDNSDLELSVLTGILRISKESIFSDLNNIEVHTLLSHHYSDKFGLLEEEVVGLLGYYEIGSELEHVKSWYNGYIFGERVIYNPWSILNFVRNWEADFKPYWVNTSSNALVKRLFAAADENTKNDFRALIEDKNIRKVVDENIVFPDIDKDPDHLFSFLLFSGYLKPVKKIQESPLDEIEYDLAIPNKEVKTLYRTIIGSWFSESARNTKLELMLRSLTSGDVETFSDILADFVAESFSYFDTGGKNGEKVFQAFAMGLVIFLNKDYLVISEEPSGYGRSDLFLIPRDTKKKGIIFEFKKVNKRRKETLETAVEKAKQQMKEKNYRQKQLSHGVTDILELAVAFEGKEILVEERDGKN